MQNRYLDELFLAEVDTENEDLGVISCGSA